MYQHAVLLHGLPPFVEEVEGEGQGNGEDEDDGSGHPAKEAGIALGILARQLLLLQVVERGLLSQLLIDITLVQTVLDDVGTSQQGECLGGASTLAGGIAAEIK